MATDGTVDDGIIVTADPGEGQRLETRYKELATRYKELATRYKTLEERVKSMLHCCLTLHYIHYYICITCLTL